MALKTKVNLKSFKGVMRSKVFGIPVPLLAVGAGVGFILLQRRASRSEDAAEGDAYADEAAAGIGSGGYSGDGGGMFGGGASGGGFYSPWPMMPTVGAGPVVAIPRGNRGGGGNRAARLSRTRTRTRVSASKGRQLKRQMRAARSAGNKDAMRRLQARARTNQQRQARQAARIARIRSRRKGGRTTSA